MAPTTNKMFEFFQAQNALVLGGVSAQAGAIRYALAMCLRSFVNEQTVEEMHVSGLLTQNIKVRERKKPGLEGARRAYTWLKR